MSNKASMPEDSAKISTLKTDDKIERSEKGSSGPEHLLMVSKEKTPSLKSDSVDIRQRSEPKHDAKIVDQISIFGDSQDNGVFTSGDRNEIKPNAKASKDNTANVATEEASKGEKGRISDHYKVAIIETIIISIVVTLCLAGILSLMYLLAVRPPLGQMNSTFIGERPEIAWRKHDENEQVELGNMCQNFPGFHKRLIQFIKRPYQVIGDPCLNYYGLVCSSICHVVPRGLCFWEVSRKFMNDCVDWHIDPDTVELWTNFLAFSQQTDIPVTPPSECTMELLRMYGNELSVIHGGDARIKGILLDRIVHYIRYINSRRVCVEERLMMYETFCLMHCCYKHDGDVAVEIGRVICQATVGWRADFTTYFRCPQNRALIEACWKNDTEPIICRPR